VPILAKYFIYLPVKDNL